MTIEEAMERVRAILNERGPERKVVPQTMLRLCPKFEADLRLILGEIERLRHDLDRCGAREGFGRRRGPRRVVGMI
jgi:hypothetical protein